MELLGDTVMSNHVPVRLEMMLVSVQDRCMVYAKRTIGSEIVLDTQWYTEVTRLMWRLVLVRLEIVLILT